MKHKVGEKVKIRSLEWYNEKKDESGVVFVDKQSFVKEMSEFCGMQAIVTYASEYRYSIDLDDGEWCWTDEMFEEQLNVKTMEQNIWNELSEESKKYVKHFFSGFNPKLHEDSAQMHLMNELFGEENLKPKPQIKTWEDVEKHYLDTKVNITLVDFWKFDTTDERIYKKISLKMIATAKIAKLIELGYGGMITDEEWKKDTQKHVIDCVYSHKHNSIRLLQAVTSYSKHFIAFHTIEQRDEFLKHNEQLCKDYYMI